MGRQAIVSVLLDTMVPLARLFLRIDMNNHERKILEMMKQLMPHLFGNGMG
jgi:hypothetical protein